ncbi:MAG: tRNA pseudouridine(38-40) synthase TruA [Clostridia bacterium]|nr:tRNA pseudouridine(38-40) synthase TruA [Clostridia bacterium]
MRILLTISYDGTDFCGYQVQPSKRTVQQELEAALNAVTGKQIKTVASGRTDSGVHALNQKVHFDYDGTIPVKSFVNVLNSVLPSDIKVINSKKVASDFSARYSAKRKTYLYRCYISQVENPLNSRYALTLKTAPNLEKIKECINLLVGTHDFKCFLASGSSVKDTVRTIYEIKVKKSGKNLDFYVTGNGFLYNMVRIIVGTLLAISEERLTLENIKQALETGERKLVGKTMPSKALCLYKVEY